MNVVEASGLGKRYGGTWALRECSLAIPAGHVAALVGPNGAGKTTLLNLTVGLVAPSAGSVTVLGGLSAGSLAALDGIAFVAQDTPLYKNLSVADMLHLTRNLNRRFDARYVKSRLHDLGIPLQRKTDRLSGGQQSQLALTLALARRPRLLVLDEPVAMLDPIARHDFMATVLMAAADDGVSVLLSSHVLAELERVADYLVLLSHGRVQVAGEVDDLLASHRVVTGPTAQADRYAERLTVVHARRGEAQAHLLVRTNGSADPVPQGWEAHPVGLEELALAYLREPGAAALPGPDRGGDAELSAATQMSTLAVPARPEQDANLRPLPWRRMVWVTWRQHRFALTGVAALLGGLAVYVWIVGRQLHHAYAAATACHPAGSPVCSVLASSFQGMDVQLANGFVWQPVPALIGAFVGAPLLARELETGTFRYAWTQGFGRRRWTLAKLVLLATAVTAAAGAFSVLLVLVLPAVLRGGQPGPVPYRRSPRSLPACSTCAGSRSLPGRWPPSRSARLAGVLIRRVVPAIVATLVAYAGLALAAGTFLRQHYLTALVTRQRQRARLRVVLSQWWTKGGRFAFGRAPIGLLERICPPPPPKAGPGNFSKSGFRWTVPLPARLHTVDQLPAGQPVLVIPAGSRAAGC